MTSSAVTSVCVLLMSASIMDIWESEWDAMVLDNVDCQIQQEQTEKALARDNDPREHRLGVAKPVSCFCGYLAD